MTKIGKAPEAALERKRIARRRARRRAKYEQLVRRGEAMHFQRQEGEIDGSLRACGLPGPEGRRSVLVAFARSADVRRAVLATMNGGGL